MTKRKVLIPLDGSNFGRQILNVVRTYFDAEETELVLLRVALPLVMPGEPLPLVVTSPASAEAGVQLSAHRVGYVWSAQEKAALRASLLDEMQSEATPLREAGYEVHTVVLFGEPAERICQYARETNIDLVAMTTHGRTGLGRFVLGSVAESVLREVTIPVLLLRTASPPAAESKASNSGASTQAR